ncbi:hypothetical protein [Paenibacillus ottowii]|uniref:hypothetical protein n=1 Tax=Paenibacillus ottowii TaxID=2315729 RepID=UPI002DBDA90F|nr:hypothetical protein [Paenibacillus sp. CMAA1739]
MDRYWPFPGDTTFSFDWAFLGTDDSAGGVEEGEQDDNKAGTSRESIKNLKNL